MKNILPRILGFTGFIIALTTLSIARPYSVVAAECVGQKPAAPARVWAKTGPGSGQVTISWDGVSDAQRYAVIYGTESGSYIYGGDPIGEAPSRQYTVNALHPGGQYYFRVIAKRDQCASPWSAEVHAGAGIQPVMNAVGFSGNMMVSEPVSNLNVKAGLPAVDTFMKLNVSKAGPVGKLGLWAKSGPKSGEVTLYWQDADSANNYHVMYGEQAGSYTYGALNIGNVRWFTVGHLAPGKIYHFALVPLLNDRPLYTTQSVGVSAYMTPPPAAAQAANQAMELMPMPTPTPTPIYQGGTMRQQSADNDYAGFDDADETGDDDQDQEEDDSQGYMMNEEQVAYPDYGEDEQTAGQYPIDPQESRTGSPYDPLFE